jgi:aminoglycoside phosphotransferase (APT) family kinase protein
MTDNAALLMRAIVDELTQRLIPELKSADAIERGNFARLVLQDLASDIDVLPGVAEQLVPEFRRVIDDALKRLEDSSMAGVAVLRTEFEGIAIEHGSARQREISALRALAARIVRQLADRSSSGEAVAQQRGAGQVLSRLGDADIRWLLAYDAARAAESEARRPDASAGSDAQPSPAGDSVTVETMTAYLRRRFPENPRAEATAVIPVPGGRSKKTYLISVRDTDALPPDLVMRQDYALRYEGTKVRDEYTPLLRLAEAGLPVPRPLHLEAEVSELGPPFILVQRMSGSAPGSYFRLQSRCPGAFRDLGVTLAKLHATEATDLGFPLGPAPERSLERLIAQYENKWRDNAVTASPVIDYAYAWARRECALDPGMSAVVHGDAGPYNVLVEGDRLTAVLDWEFAHVGDPAEDLGIVRVYAEDVMDWHEFVSIYVAAGGREVPERRVRLGMMLQFLKGTTLVAASGRNFVEGWTREFIKGANAFTGLRLIELRIAALLRRFESDQPS